MVGPILGCCSIFCLLGVYRFHVCRFPDCVNEDGKPYLLHECLAAPAIGKALTIACEDEQVRYCYLYYCYYYYYWYYYYCCYY